MDGVDVTWRDVTWQFVPDTSSSDRKTSVADSRQPCTTDDEWWRWRQVCVSV